MKKITPFSNGTEFLYWHETNCEVCKKYELVSTERSKAGCKFAFDIDIASVSDGKIPLNTAKWIGYDGHNLNPDCNMKNIEFRPAKFNRKFLNQLRLL